MIDERNPEGWQVDERDLPIENAALKDMIKNLHLENVMLAAKLARVEDLVKLYEKHMTDVAAILQGLDI